MKRILQWPVLVWPASLATVVADLLIVKHFVEVDKARSSLGQTDLLLALALTFLMLIVPMLLLRDQPPRLANLHPLKSLWFVIRKLWPIDALIIAGASGLVHGRLATGYLEDGFSIVAMTIAILGAIQTSSVLFLWFIGWWEVETTRSEEFSR
ncbi:MAG: hypothetical protein V1778_04395 [bacterium]